jgi:hypothetical protein
MNFFRIKYNIHIYTTIFTLTGFSYAIPTWIKRRHNNSVRKIEVKIEKEGVRTP